MKIIYRSFTENLTDEVIKIAEKAIENKREVFYLVPTSMSFDLEREILEKMTIHAQIKLQVLSFKRFAWYLLKDNPIFNQVQLTDTGKLMVFRKVLAKLKQEDALTVFKGEINQIGFLTQLVDLSKELEESCIELETLPETLKYQELALILKHYYQSLAGKFRQENTIEVLIEQLEKKQVNLKENSLIILEGFSRLSPIELNLIKCLESAGIEVLVALHISEPAINCQIVDGNIYEATLDFTKKIKSEIDFFGKSISFVNKKVSKELQLIDKDPFSEKEVLVNAWEKINEWDGNNNQFDLSNNQYIETWENINMIEEIKSVAKDIRYLVSTGVKYQQIQVLCGNLADYDGIIQPIFNKYQIHYYFDGEVKQANHPLVEFIESLIALSQYNYQYTDVMRVLRTELLPFDFVALNDSQDNEYRQIIDRFEVYILKNGISGHNFFSQKWQMNNGPKEMENFAKIEFKNFKLIQECLISASSVIANFIKKPTFNAFLGVLDYIRPNYIKLAKLATTQDEINQDREAWDTLMSILKEYNSIYQSSDEYFVEMLSAGIKQAVFKKIPAAIDLVQIKSYELIRPDAADYVYAIGLNATNFPKIAQNHSLLTDDERIEINNLSKDGKLEVKRQESSSKSIFTASQLLASANNKLILSSSVVYLDTAVSQSIYIQRLQSELLVRKKVNQPNSLEQVNPRMIGSYDGLLEDLGVISRELLSKPEIDGQPNVTFWKIMYRILLKKNFKYQAIFQSLDQSITPTPIVKETLNVLYPKQINASVSSFENFYHCEYKYYLANSLNLQEVDTMTLDNRIQGNYLHRVFEILLADDFPDKSSFDSQLENAIKLATTEFQIYFDFNAINQYYKQQFDQIINNMALILKKQIGLPIQIKATEFGFGRDGISGLNFDLVSQKELKVRGFIDRIDEINHTIGAVDYKSGNQSFDLKKALDGMQLQLITYLDFLQNVYKKDKSSLWGAAYLHFNEPIIKLNELTGLTDETVASEKLKSLIYNGIYVKETFDSFNDELKSVYNFNKVNTFSEAQVNHLIDNNRKLFVNAGNELLSGRVKINPAVNSKKVSIGCQYCQFKSICRYEPDIHNGRLVGNKNLSSIDPAVNDNR
ncbi:MULTISPECIES: PD-(D/E)XK nuclease family protein [unclassified Enterococcus]|uniref:PD-(D/E)XK nuclease family protein n=1 Tax=unclassified Enterococcus TaxID=2608891 RepID=UPI00155307F6|nr:MULTISPECIES: PD-(D/E)XK nuclease family protein [unclassified Enterococcus]MBS7577765.1 PD-(D/E)XK nuclease family protein [Enterococcus sp. MMGLQ5-2]MBS7585025.1 PD-(D/E)XK nuclease family protein [Enterococcus sp. MMGLQ5-1]NPD12881.1 hypothetical protein [Enterococcus sp. MMGLQ5-1]NPD37595.1 hypothetical protein [Enterococcus sp. MMGLQ5-2]